MFGVKLPKPYFLMRHRHDYVLYDKLKVEKFINKEEWYWNKDVITTHLGDEMVNIISGLPLTKMGLGDKFI